MADAVFALLICYFVPMDAIANEVKLVLRVESRSQEGLLQQAIVFSKKKLTLTRNANFFCEPKPFAHLGRFDVTETEVVDLAKSLHGIAEIEADTSYSEVPSSPHDFLFFRGPENVTDRPFIRNAINKIISDQCFDERWRHTDTRGIELVRNRGKLFIQEFKNGKKASSRLKSPGAAGCKAYQSFVTCKINGYGQLILRTPD